MWIYQGIVGGVVWAHVCMCTHLLHTRKYRGVWALVSVHGGQSRTSDVFFYYSFSSHLISWTEGFSLTRKLDFSVRLPRQPALRNCLNLLSSAGVTGIGGHDWLSYWILGVQIRSSGSHTWRESVLSTETSLQPFAGNFSEVVKSHQARHDGSCLQSQQTGNWGREISAGLRPACATEWVPDQHAIEALS